jgi:hypothetical protein
MRTQNGSAAANRGKPGNQENFVRKRRNWLNSVLAAAALITVSSLGGLLVYDWYFSFVLDGLSQSFRPIADALSQESGHHSQERPTARR